MILREATHFCYILLMSATASGVCACASPNNDDSVSPLKADRWLGRELWPFG
ncbi:hypothetical protein BO94DRAFT_224736 [Aspergillus sclerotioniger CBS 115572]|uniref:Uncharacterized protein n=1 Tax=Aspergillus sclerotioniger CBS 115572 TaxID=1450535 RepID=A0A317XF45_9EURO|nr:hypothetical protein BO94DRAFT_224736 [Aspergillus sclerotioniger CBS 115572]PWY95310.1 hypothetical protein BO94DRAFT_224736 [Aspergillus sclerotioniger CBS 115572]